MTERSGRFDECDYPDLEKCPRRRTIMAQRTDDGRRVEQTVTGKQRATELIERWQQVDSLCNIRVFSASAPMTDVTRHFIPRLPNGGDDQERVTGWEKR
jgi:hypothetical protein